MRKAAHFLALLLWASLAVAQTRITISDALYYADGTKPSGRLEISWPALKTADNYTIPAGRLAYAISQGVVNLALVPNVGSTPAGTSYRVTYMIDRGGYTEYWVIPASGPVTIAQIRASVVPSPASTFAASQVNAGVFGTGTYRFPDILCVGSFCPGPVSGQIGVAGPDAGMFFGDRSLASWPGTPVAGNRFVLYNSQGLLYVWTDVNGNIVQLDASGRLGIGSIQTKRARIDPTGLTTARDYTLPDVTGTVGIFTSLTANRCARINAAGTGLEPAAADCAAGGGAPTGATYITQTPDATLTAEQALSALATGLLKNTTGTGVLSIAAAGTDYVTPSGSETLTNKTLTTPTIGDFTNAAHIHTNAAGGGQITDAALSAAIGLAKGGTNQTAWTAARCVQVNAGGTALESASAACGSGGGNHNLLSATHPDTAPASPVLGDVLYGNVTPAWTKLSGNITTTRQFLRQVGTGAVSAAPAWDTLVAGDIPALDASKITSGVFAAARIQEVVSILDLSDYTAKSGTGTTAIGATFTGLAANDCPMWSGSNWVNLPCGSVLTTKGDLHTYSTTDTRLPVGADGSILVADSAQTTGLAWSAGTGTGAPLRATSATVTTPTISGALGGNLDLGAAGRAVLTEVANEGVTGTTVNLLAKLTGAPSTAVKAAITDTGGVIGVVAAGAGTTGNAQIAVSGRAGCTFDGATTAGNYVKISSTTAGNCSDAGATYPTSGQVLGRVLSTNGAGGTYDMEIFGPEIKAAAGGGGGDSVTVNAAAVTDADLDDATPAAGAGKRNVAWQKDASSPANISAQVAVVMLLDRQQSIAAITGDATDKTIYTYTLPGGTMAANKCIRVTARWRHSTGTTSTTYKFWFGATSFSKASTAGGNSAMFTVCNNSGSTTAQEMDYLYWQQGSAVLSLEVVTAAAENTASDVVVKLTFNVASPDAITPINWLVELVQ